MISIPRTLAALSQKIRGDMRRELPGTDATVWPNNLSIFAKVFVLAIHEVDLRGAWLYRQIFAHLAEASHLERHAYEYGMARKQPSRAFGEIETTGTAGTVYPAGISFLSGGAEYTTASDARAADNGVLRFKVISRGTGSAQNRVDGDTFALADAALYPSIGAEAIVINGGVGGAADRESDESLRARVLDRKRRGRKGGAVSDYEQMAREVPGVAKAWAWSFAGGPGTVGVWFLFEGRENGIPLPSDVAAVRRYLEVRRLIRVGLSVSPPIPEAVNITIGGLETDNATTREAIRTALVAALYERARPGVAIEAFSLSRSWLAEAISSAVGESRHRLVYPADDLIFTDGRYPVLGTVTYV